MLEGSVTKMAKRVKNVHILLMSERIRGWFGETKQSISRESIGTDLYLIIITDSFRSWYFTVDLGNLAVRMTLPIIRKAIPSWSQILTILASAINTHTHGRQGSESSVQNIHSWNDWDLL